MNSIVSHIKNWLGYDRRERRSASILIVIIIVVFASRYIIPGTPTELRNISSEMAGYRPAYSANDSIQNDSVILFTFDPNTATSGDLVKLGLTEKQANTVLNYRNAGGKFYDPSDFSVIYGIDEKKKAELLPYIKIGKSNISVNTSSSSVKANLMNLNSCDSTMLESLPGIGPVFAARIIKYRNILGGYSDKNQLMEVYGITNETFILIANKVYADSSEVIRIKINSASYTDFLRHPYFETGEINSIIKYRELMGKVSNKKELIINNIITAEKMKKITPYISFE